MKKVVVIGDIHASKIWKDILQQETDCDKVIFLGDYFDTYEEISPQEEADNFRQILKYKEDNKDKEIIILLGNHDIHYLPAIDETYTSGFNPIKKVVLNDILSNWKDIFKICHNEGRFTFSHAGISSVFCDKVLEEWNENDVYDKLNQLFIDSPYKFLFNPRCRDPYGDNMIQSPIWIRPYSLKVANRDTVLENMVQVVGHTNIMSSMFPDDCRHSLKKDFSIQIGEKGGYIYNDSLSKKRYVIIDLDTNLVESKYVLPE